MDLIVRIQKRKKRQLLVLSASSIATGLECLYLETNEAHWHIHHSQTVHYPQSIKQAYHHLVSQEQHIFSLQELAVLDNRMTMFLEESAKNVLTSMPKIKRHLDCIVLKKFTLWEGALEASPQSPIWNITSGDADHLARAFNVPVLTDFIRQDILNAGAGTLPIEPGDGIIGKQAGEIAVFINLGLIADIVAFDTVQSKLLLNSDTGPGTILIDHAAREAGCNDGFDRDGTAAAAGTVHTEVFETLLQDEWFRQPGPKRTNSNYLTALMYHQCLRSLSPADKLATITAFSALTISDFYKREYTCEKKPESIWLSGGGSNNLALVEFIKAYFAPITIRNCEELGVPNNSRIPLSLGLTVSSYLDNTTINLPGVKLRSIRTLGKWAFPH